MGKRNCLINFLHKRSSNKTKTKRPKNSTTHAYYRAKKRLGLEENKNIESLFRKAHKYGKMASYLPPGELRDWLFLKEHPGKKIKVYKNNVFVFFKNSKRCITMYPLPEKFRRGK